jgi:hypothetical protein
MIENMAQTLPRRDTEHPYHAPVGINPFRRRRITLVDGFMAARFILVAVALVLWAGLSA